MRFKVSVPALLAACGVRKWLVTRVFHAPAAWLPTLCAVAGVTEEQWRAMELAWVALLYDGIEARL